MQVVSVSGWSLDRLVQFDLACPGPLSHFCMASNERRHIIAAFLAVDQLHANFRTPNQAGWFLRHAGHDAILRAAFGDVPVGLRGELGRTDAAVQPRRYYSYMRALLANGDTSLRRLVDRLPTMTLERLPTPRALPVDARKPLIVDRLTSVRVARDLYSFIQLISERGADRAAMIAAFESHKRPLGEIARHWSLKTALPPIRSPEAPYTGQSRAAAICVMPRDFRNCARIYIADILDHVTAFAIFSFDEPERAMVHLQREGEGR